MERGAIKKGALYWEVDLISIPGLSKKSWQNCEKNTVQTRKKTQTEKTAAEILPL